MSLKEDLVLMLVERVYEILLKTASFKNSEYEMRDESYLNS